MYRVVRHAEHVARLAHGNALNKHNGEPYITHVERVVGYLLDADVSPTTLAVGWLHDVVEDTAMTLVGLRALGFAPEILDAVDAITQRPHEARLDYYARVGPTLSALQVKLLGDMRDNTDPERRKALPQATRDRLDGKYLRGYTTLLTYTRMHRGWGM